MEDIFRSLILVAGVVLILFALHRVAVWMESRGWLYYRRVKPRSSNLGNAFLELQSMLEPGKRHVILPNPNGVAPIADQILIVQNRRNPVGVARLVRGVPG